MDDDEARDLLRTERIRVQALLVDIGATGLDDRAAANDGGDMSDPAASLVSEETDDAVAAGLRARLAAIRRAEERLTAGTYGRSVRSGNTIPDHRLRADPAAELTIDEAQSQR
ncbi:MAG: hypothetical protein ACLPVY_22835 [Acidimicrobiia bacterium]